MTGSVVADTKIEDVHVAVFGSSQTALGARIAEHVLEPACNVFGGDARTVSVEWCDPATQCPFGNAEALKPYVRALFRAPIVIIDFTNPAIGCYLLGLREALSTGATIPCTDGPAEFWPEAEGRDRFLDLSETGVRTREQDIIRLLKPAGDRPIRPWANPIHQTRAVEVKLAEAPLTSTFDKQGFDPSTGPAVWERKHPQGEESFPPIGIIEGNLARVRDIPVWVNSENSLMQMGRVWERSISAQIRRLGSRQKGSLRNPYFDDAMGVALAEAMGTARRLDLGSVLVTRAPVRTQLSRTKNEGGMPWNGVKLVAHVAALEPRHDQTGYSPERNISGCVENVFAKVRAFASAERIRDDELDSVLFPIFGAGDGGAPTEIAAAKLIANIVRHGRGSNCLPFKTVFVLAYKPSDLNACQAALSANGYVPATREDQA